MDKKQLDLEMKIAQQIMDAFDNDLPIDAALEAKVSLAVKEDLWSYNAEKSELRPKKGWRAKLKGKEKLVIPSKKGLKDPREDPRGHGNFTPGGGTVEREPRGNRQK